MFWKIVDYNLLCVCIGIRIFLSNSNEAGENSFDIKHEYEFIEFWNCVMLNGDSFELFDSKVHNKSNRQGTSEFS